jgi:uncharacterized protein (UPF0332 family)
MKPESAAFMEKSREFLVKAQGMFDNHWPDETGRAAYLAGLHAAQAFIFETSREIAKSHKRVQSEFGRLTKGDPRFDMELRAFLGRTYNLKAIADYETGHRASLLKAPVPPSGRRAGLWNAWRTFCPRMGARRAHRMQYRSFDSRCIIQEL